MDCRVSKTGKTILLLAWIVLFAMLLQRDYFVKTLEIHEAQVIKQAREESFLGVYFKGERIGFVKYRITPETTDSILLLQDAYLVLNILNESHPVSMQLSARLTADHRLQSFEFELASPFYSTTAQGKVTDNLVQFSMDTGKETISHQIRLTRPPYLPINQRGTAGVRAT